MRTSFEFGVPQLIPMTRYVRPTTECSALPTAFRPRLGLAVTLETTDLTPLLFARRGKRLAHEPPHNYLTAITASFIPEIPSEFSPAAPPPE